MKQKTRKLSIKFKILIPTSVCVLVLCVIMGWSSYKHMNDGMVAMGVQEADMAAKFEVTVVPMFSPMTSAIPW